MNPKTIDMAQKLKKLKPGGFFYVPTKHDRNTALQAAKVLLAGGAINFEIVTRKADEGEGFNVIRIPS